MSPGQSQVEAACQQCLPASLPRLPNRNHSSCCTATATATQQQQCGHAALLLWLFWLTIFRSFYPTHTLTRLDIDMVLIYTLVVPTSLMLCVYLTHSFYLFRVYPFSFSFSFVQFLLKLNAIISCQIPHRAAGNPSMRIRTSTLSWA